ncbi:MAG TPA: hypothetical protein VG099_09570 [Gemmataceae bacterium]|nr:hypothetical protein [Gemmataceae bacterium]
MTTLRWLVLAAYLLGGFLPGLADLQFGRCVQALGAKPGVATAISVNLLLPLLAIGLAAVFPRLATVWLGAILSTSAFAAGLAVNYFPPRPWGIGLLVRSVPPVLVLACLGYGVLGTLVAIGVRALRQRPCSPGTTAPQG